MKIFADTANVSDIKRLSGMGLIDGVTTNPSLVAKEGKSFRAIIKQITKLVNGDISAEVIATDTKGMYKEGIELAKIHKNIVIKVPLTPDGLAAVRLFSKKKIRCNVTLCFSANQALLAAKAGAHIVSPFVGRLDDIGQTGMDLIDEILHIYENYGYKTNVLVASIRSTQYMKEAALLGADIATAPPKVIDQMIKHSLTDQGLAKFLNDWKKAKLFL